MTAPLDMYGSFSGAFRCTSATTNHFMTRDLGTGENWYSFDLPVGVNIIMLEADRFTAGSVNVDVRAKDDSEPNNRLAQLARLSEGVWKLSKLVAVVTPSSLRFSLTQADESDIGKRIAVFVSVVEPS